MFVSLAPDGCFQIWQHLEMFHHSRPVACVFTDTHTETATHNHVVMTGGMDIAGEPPAAESTLHRAVTCVTHPGIPTAHVVLMATQLCHLATTANLSVAGEETDLTGWSTFS